MAFIGRVLCGVSGEKDDEEEEVVKNRAPPAPTHSLSISCRKVRQLYEFHLTWSMLCVVLCVEQRIIFHLDRYVCARAIALVIRPMHCLWRWRYYSTYFFFRYFIQHNCPIRLKITKFLCVFLFVSLWKCNVRNLTSSSSNETLLASQVAFEIILMQIRIS